MNINKLIFEIDQKYKNLLRTICMQAIDSFVGLPLVWEDVYYMFLNEIPKLVLEFDSEHESNLEFQTFIGIKCKHFSLNYCRVFNSNKHKVMNRTVYVSQEERISVLEDSVQIKKPKIDIGIFNKKEFEFYTKHILDQKKIIKVAEEMGISLYKAHILKTKIETKIYLDFKN